MCIAGDNPAQQCNLGSDWYCFEGEASIYQGARLWVQGPSVDGIRAWTVSYVGKGNMKERACLIAEQKREIERGSRDYITGVMRNVFGNVGLD